MATNFDEQLKNYIQEICSETKPQWNIWDKSETLKDWLKNHRINKSTFGKIIGVSGGTITKYINDPSQLRIGQIKKLAKETHTPIEILINIIENES